MFLAMGVNFRDSAVKVTKLHNPQEISNRFKKIFKIIIHHILHHQLNPIIDN